jgi:hypothetical protein
MRKQNFLLLDVETAGGLGNPLIYDLGFAIVNREGEVLEKHSFLIKEIFNEPTLMNSAYYAEKIPSYVNELKNSKHKLVPFAYAIKVMMNAAKAHNVETVSAYNLAFDLRALNSTSKYLKGKGFTFYNKIQLCIWSLACEVLFTQKTYQKVARREGWVSQAGNVKTSAEMAFRYITGDYNFIEEHKGLSDVLIEAQILAKCIRQKKKVKSGVLVMPWKIPNQKHLTPAGV